MKSKIQSSLVTILSVIFLTAGILGGSVSSIWASGSGEKGLIPPADKVQMSKVPQTVMHGSKEGLWFMPKGGNIANELNMGEIADSGGPDQFGYLWLDNSPLDWIDASGGSDTGIDGTTDHAGPIPIGFSFKYYENTYTELYVSRNGYISFHDDDIWWKSQSEIPSRIKPNDVIAPHWVPIDNINGYIRYLSGGDAPHRWFAVEWNRVESDCCADGDTPEEYTFEVILHENGDIVFQYGDMIFDGSYYCQSSGIEDSLGIDGLSITAFCEQIPSNHAVRIYRPDPAARVFVHPASQGSFVGTGEGDALSNLAEPPASPLTQTTESFKIMVNNRGDFGTDTFDFSITSAWPLSVYSSNGVTPLTDTDTDGLIDTGPVAQGTGITIVARIDPPPGAAVGDHNQAEVKLCSSIDPGNCDTTLLATAVPGPFAQVFMDTNNGAMSLCLARPEAQALTRVTEDWHYGNNPAVSETPDGFVYLWSTSAGIEYTVLNHSGGVIKEVTRLTDSTGSEFYHYYEPVPAVTHNGRIGVAWREDLYNFSSGLRNYNIYFAILNAKGDVILEPTNLTLNDQWESQPTVGFTTPSISSTTDNHFVLAWRRWTSTSEGWTSDIFYTIKGLNGADILPVTEFTENAYDPALAALNNSNVMLIWEQSNNPYFAVLNSEGSIVYGPSMLSSVAGSPYDFDAVQLADGNIVIAWTEWNYIQSLYQIGYAVLDNGFQLVKASTVLDTSSPDSLGPSLAKDGSNQAILTWSDNWYNSAKNLYYAMLDSSGNIVTPPMIFYTGQGEEPSISTNTSGYGNTSYILDRCRCDLNGDHVCDMQDWLKFGQAWGETDCYDEGVMCDCDLNDDGVCDMQDWLLFGEDWGRTDCP